MKARPTIERLREVLRYDADSGNLYLKASDRTGFDASKPIGWDHQGYWRVSVDGKNIPAHQVAWAMHYGEWPPAEIDHRDQDKTNNRIDNLRLANTSLNQANTKRTNAVQCRGVRIMKGKYQANIKYQKKQMNLGTYETIDEAAHAYNKKAIELFGEFAVLNPIGEDKCAQEAVEQKGGA